VTGTARNGATFAGTFSIDVDLNHDGRFTGAGELDYASGTLDSANVGQADLYGLVNGTYKVRARAAVSAGEVVSSTATVTWNVPTTSNAARP